MPAKNLQRPYHYKGGFPLRLLTSAEQVSASGDYDGACIISGPGYEVRFELGEWISRDASGMPVSSKVKP